MAQYSYSDMPQKTAMACLLPFLDVDHNPGHNVIIETEKKRIAKGAHTSRCYLMRKYQISDEDARAAMREITGDDRQSTMEE